MANPFLQMRTSKLDFSDEEEDDDSPILPNDLSYEEDVIEPKKRNFILKDASLKADEIGNSGNCELVDLLASKMNQGIILQFII